MSLTLIVIMILTAVLSIVAYMQGGTEFLREGLLNGIDNMSSAVLFIIFAFLIVGLFGKVIPKKTISKWLGVSTGSKGSIIGIGAGLLFPGGPYGYYPVIKELIKNGAAPAALFGFLSSKFLLGIARIPIEVAIIGPWPTFVRHLICIPFPFAISYLAGKLSASKYFNIEHIANEPDK